MKWVFLVGRVELLVPMALRCVVSLGRLAGRRDACRFAVEELGGPVMVLGVAQR